MSSGVSLIDKKPEKITEMQKEAIYYLNSIL
jgi:hypothetical protein